MVDFVAVGFDALLNHAAKFTAFSGGDWQAARGAGSLRGLVRRRWTARAGALGHARRSSRPPGGGPLQPADAAGLLLAAIEDDGPVIFMEPKLLTSALLDSLAGTRRSALDLPIPQAGRQGLVPDPPTAVRMGVARHCRNGADLTLVSVGIGVHRCMAAAEILGREGVQAGVLDLRSISPFDRAAVLAAGDQTGHLVVVDEDYLRGGLSGEIAALLLEHGVDVRFARVATESTIPYARHLEAQVLPDVARIEAAARRLLGLAA